MKKVALILLLVIGVSMFAAAQESDLYVANLYIEKVYATTLGYRIDYRRPSSLILATAYLPLEWFGGPGSIGKLVYADDKATPFISIVWRGTDIDHFVLYVKRNQNDLTWGTLTVEGEMANRFQLDSPQFDF